MHENKFRPGGKGLRAEPREVLRELARRAVPDFHALVRLAEKVNLLLASTQTPLTASVAQQMFDDIEQATGSRVSVQEIELAVLRSYAVTHHEIIGKSRRQPVARARQVAMFLARRLTLASLNEIGAYFGGKTHTTVIFAVNKIAQEYRDIPHVRAEIDQLVEGLSPGTALDVSVADVEA
jgi:chromosomal replication initiator protein